MMKKMYTSNLHQDLKPWTRSQALDPRADTENLDVFFLQANLSPKTRAQK